MDDTPAAQPDSPSPPAPSPKQRPARTFRQRIVRIAIRLGVLYAFVCLGLVLLESRLVFPGAYFDATPYFDANRFTPENPIVGEVVTFPYDAVDGNELRGRLLIRDNADRVILFLHGNGIRATDMDGWTQRLSDAMNATVLTAEYRGYQDDDFTPSESSSIDDAVSAIDALAVATKVPADEITIYARSLGGGIGAGLVDAMQQRGAPPRSLILDRTFDSVVNVGAKQFFWLPVRLLMRNRFDSVERLQNFSGNVVQIHGTPDRIVPMKNGRALFESLSTKNKAWIETSDMYHNDRISRGTLVEALDQLKRFESGSESPPE